MNWWIKLGCFLTGWNIDILKQCSEASYTHLKKNASALLILILMWGFTGYCFASRYVHAPIWGCCLTSIVFIIVVIQIERQIILTIGKSHKTIALRFFIAIVMSVLGSTVIDQFIFGKDVERKMVEITDRQVQEQLPMRLNVINSRLSELHANIDSMMAESNKLNEEIAAKPTVSVISTQITNQPVQGSDGSIRNVASKSVSTSSIPNPRIEQARMLDKNLDEMKRQEADYNNRKLNMETTLRKELSSNIGFLEELNALIEIMSSRPVALAFYIIVFSFLMFLELFIVTGKAFDKVCDYEMIIEHQLWTHQRKLEGSQRNRLNFLVNTVE